VAVLYFDNLSRDTADAYLADGLTEEIIVRLGQIQRLDVKSRYEVQRFRGRSGGDPATLGHTLGAANIVTGSVQKAGQRVRVRVELVRATNRARLWGDVFDRSSDDVLDIEEQIASAVVQGIAGQLLPEERAVLAKRPTYSAEAYDLYLRGRALMRFEEAPLRHAIASFEQALALDSGFAPAAASIAQAWGLLADDFVAPRVANPQARAAAQWAVRADAGAAEGWANLAMVTYWFDWNPVQAESLARRAIALDARSSWAHMMRGLALMHLAPVGEAVAEFERAFDLDSLSEVTESNAAWGLIHLRRYDAAANVARRFQRAVPGSARGYWDEARVYLVQRDCSRALPLLQRQRAAAGGGPGVEELYCEGHADEARQLLASRIRAQEQSRAYFRAGDVARTYVLLGDRDQAFLWLDRAFEAREATLAYLTLDPQWDPLREDPRFVDLVRRTGLATVGEH
jgi:TolB-like protein